MMPASGSAGSCRAKPAISAAAEAPCPRASTTSTTGQPVQCASAAVEPVSPSGPVPSNRPMTPSHSTRSASLWGPPASAASVAGRIAQTSRLMHGPPLAAAWKVGSM